MPITALTMLTGMITMIGCALFIRHRIGASEKGGSYQARLLSNFFLHLGIFLGFMFLPHLLVNSNHPEQFPLAMAIGYTFGHIFFYTSSIYVVRLLCSIVPRLVTKEVLVVVIFGIFATLATAFNAATMIWGKRPQFDYEHQVTLFNAHPLVGACIGIVAIASYLPTAILMLINGFRNHNARLRSFTLGLGFIVILIAGPLHDVARTSSLYVAADLFSILGELILVAGVAYQIEEKISVGRTMAVSSASAR